MITRDNYEIWFLDHAEGKLTSGERAMLFSFLQKNPDLKNEFDAFENISFDAPREKTTTNDDLKKKQSWLLKKYSEDELIFNFTEGNLSNEELREWNDLVKTMPAFVARVERAKNVIIKPLAEETFNGKSFLKREQTVFAITGDNCEEYLYSMPKQRTLVYIKQ